MPKPTGNTNEGSSSMYSKPRYKPTAPYANQNGSRTKRAHQSVVNFAKLDVASLKRYRKHFGLADVRANSSKAELVQAVSKHFAQQTVEDEDSILSKFVHLTKRQRPALFEEKVPSVDARESQEAQQMDQEDPD
mmetsp:Transcript_5298/g.8187  ORF Transcript_5298/g.8187 Transcript_5298/m.8187 type:complete len:134 (+) Transcript_5298:137-538(+)|eukprot:CAMPEP_0184658896 /NCGR_PEP_ID=MMETSP0308-20130426/27261_1 /TAXON_ID=38269 /ORGANISM="Gloeochaete witrockiana, Strain SAG 46.84" /LENGTH=133 /DNA_ID=CAMNT_0027098237 /DNA_START=116 /DNA_END=517 /DNA_ORIENTATION=-